MGSGFPEQVTFSFHAFGGCLEVVQMIIVSIFIETGRTKDYRHLISVSMQKRNVIARIG